MTGTVRDYNTNKKPHLILIMLFQSIRYYNAGGRPTKEVLEKQPWIVHRVQRDFGVQVLLHQLYEEPGWIDWRQMDTVHLLFNHRFYLDAHFEYYPVFNERNIQHYPFAFGEMARLVWNNASSS